MFTTTHLKIGARLVLLAILVCLGACTQWHYQLGEPVSAQARTSLKTGAPLGEVLDTLGPPIRISRSHNGYLMAWEHWQVSENSAGISLGAVGADLLSVDWGDTRVAGEFLLATFDRAHRLTGLTHTRWNGTNGSGRAIQPSIGLADIVDVSDLVEDLPHHSWGAQLLIEPAAAQNAPHSPDSGGSGIEQRGTPSGTGQRSLERP